MIRRLSTLAVAAVTLTIAMAPAHGAEKWDAAPWLADVEVMHQAFATKYANRMWLEEQRAIPVDALFELVRQNHVDPADSGSDSSSDEDEDYGDMGHASSTSEDDHQEDGDSDAGSAGISGTVAG